MDLVLRLIESDLLERIRPLPDHLARNLSHVVNEVVGGEVLVEEEKLPELTPDLLA
jgi:hypothetical protein